MTGIPWASSGSRSATWPARWTGMIAFVRSLTSSATWSGSMLRSESRTSANTGVAPVWTMTFAVAGQVIGDVITSSPGPTPTASSARCKAAVPEATASTCSASTNSAKRRSSSAAFGPVVSQPDRRVSATAAISSSPIAGGWKPSMVCLRSDVSFCTDLEAYETSSLVGPLQRLLATVAHCQHRSGAVGAAQERPEDVAGLAVDAHFLNAVDGTCLLDARDLPEHPLRRHEEAHDGTADLRHHMECGRPDRLPECRLEREAVQVDSERRVDELSVVAASDTGRDLDHLRALGADPKLGIGRPVLDAERLDRGARDLCRLPTGLARPDVRQRDPERRRLCGQTVGDGQRME